MAETAELVAQADDEDPRSASGRWPRCASSWSAPKRSKCGRRAPASSLPGVARELGVSQQAAHKKLPLPSCDGRSDPVRPTPTWSPKVPCTPGRPSRAPVSAPGPSRTAVGLLRLRRAELRASPVLAGSSPPAGGQNRTNRSTTGGALPCTEPGVDRERQPTPRTNFRTVHRPPVKATNHTSRVRPKSATEAPRSPPRGPRRAQRWCPARRSHADRPHQIDPHRAPGPANAAAQQPSPPATDRSGSDEAPHKPVLPLDIIKHHRHRCGLRQHA